MRKKKLESNEWQSTKWVLKRKIVISHSIIVKETKDEGKSINIYRTSRKKK